MDRDQILAALQAIIDEAGDSPLSEDQAQRYEELEGQLQAVERDLQIRSRQRAYRTPAPGQRVETAGGGDADDAELRAAFDSYLRTGQAPAELAELRAQSTTDAAGGYTIPTEFRQKITERMKAFGGVGEAVETITTSAGNPLEWPTVDDTANAGEVVAEAAEPANQADVVFGQVTLGAYKYMAAGANDAPIRVSVELLQDSAFDIAGFLARIMGRRIARAQAVHLVDGSGSGQPKGLVNGKTGIEPAAGTGITYADLVTYVHSVDPDYRDGASWAFNDQSLAYLRKLEDDNGRPLWSPAGDGLAGSMPGGTLLGYPVVIDQAFDDILLTAGAGQNWGAFGNLQLGYIRRQVQDVTVIVDPYSRAHFGQVQYTAWARMDGKPQDPNAYVALAGHTA